MTGVAAGQSVPRAEIFGGYSYGNFAELSSRSNFSGWNGSVEVNVYRWFGLVTDLGGLYGGHATASLPPFPGGGSVTETSHLKFHTFLFGPQFSYRHGRMSLFAHLLIGEARGSETYSLACVGACTGFIPGTANFAAISGTAAPGVGFDYAFRKKLAWRTQADYLPLGTTSNLRVSTGLVFRVGK